MKPEDLDAELNRLWARVAAGTPEPTSDQSIAFPPDFAGLGASRSAALDALLLVKRQYSEHKARWERVLRAKEDAVRTLSQTLNRAEAEIAELRRNAQRFDVRLVTEVSALTQKLQAAQALLRMEEERFAKEEKRLVDSLGKLDSENRNFKDRQKSLTEEVEALSSSLVKSRQENQISAEKVENLSAAVREARTAMAGTVSELVAERQARERAEQDLRDARQRLAETSERSARMEKVWEEERRQWQELFKREKSFHLP